MFVSRISRSHCHYLMLMFICFHGFRGKLCVMCNKGLSEYRAVTFEHVTQDTDGLLSSVEKMINCTTMMLSQLCLFVLVRAGREHE